MMMSFDYFGNYEIPKITLCNPGTKLVNGVPTLAYGDIPLTSDEEIIYNYNDLCELSFRAYYIYDPADSMNLDNGSQYISKSYAEIQKYRYLYVDGAGFFRIDEVTETIQDCRRTKDVHAVSCDIELKNFLMPYIQDGTYPLVGIDQQTGAVGILGQAISKVYNWAVGTVDPALNNARRTFTDVDVSKNVYAFLTDDLQTAFDCIFQFDIINRTINVIARSNVGFNTDIHLTGDDLVEMIKVSDQTDGPFTAYRVFGDDAMSVSAVNPLGSNVVYDFTNYIPWMTPSLGQKVSEWQAAVISAEPDYYEASMQYFEYSALAEDSRLELERLNKQKSIYETCKSNVTDTQSTAPVVQANEKLDEIGGDEITLSDSVSTICDAIDDKIDEVDDLIADETTNYEALVGQVAYYNGQRAAIHNEVAMETYFTTHEMEILSSYIFEETYTDNYITLDSSIDVYSQIENMDLIYHRAKNALDVVSKPQREFTIDTEDFLFVNEFFPWVQQLVPACAIHIEISDLDIIELFLSSITINYEDRSTRLVFSNKLTKLDRRTLFNNLFGSLSQESITNVKDIDTQ